MLDKPPSLVWPRLLGLPSEDVKIVYLDLCHWIYLAQASLGQPKGAKFVPSLEACRAARSAGTAVFVLSAIHYMEMLKIKDPAQRRSISNVMEELTDFATLVYRSVVMKLEVDSMLDPYANRTSSLPNIPLIGRGIRHALGLRSGFKFTGPSGDETHPL